MSIADKLKTVAQKMEDVYRTGLFKYAPKSTASGESILLENSAPEPFVNMKPYGHSWQNGTPSPTNPIPIESAKEIKVLGGNYFNINNFVNQDDGVTIQDNGFAIVNQSGEGHGNFIWSATLGQLCPNLRDGDEVYLNMDIVNPSGINEYYLYGTGRDWINGTSLVITQADLDGNFNVYGSYGTTTIYKNIVVSKAPIPFEPYKEQTLTLPPLHEGDAVDYSTKKKVQNSTFKSLADLYWKQGQPNRNGDGLTFYAEPSEFGTIAYLSAHFKIVYETQYGAWETLSVGECLTKDGYIIACTQHSSLEEFTSWLSSENVQTLVKLAEPIETDLTDEEIYAFKKLRANSPNTTIIGQGQVDVIYIVDNRQ